MTEKDRFTITGSDGSSVEVVEVVPQIPAGTLNDPDATEDGLAEYYRADNYDQVFPMADGTFRLREKAEVVFTRE